MLAARLSEEPGARVLLLEAGSADRTRAMAVPNAWPAGLRVADASIMPLIPNAHPHATILAVAERAAALIAARPV